MRPMRTIALACVPACFASGQPTAFPRWDPPIRAVPFVTDGMESPTHLAAIPGDYHHVFVSELGGRIRTIRERTLLDTPLLDLRDVVTTACECGVLGFAFSPEFDLDRHVYVMYTRAEPEPANVLARFRVDEPAPGEPLVADRASEEQLLTIPMPHVYHLAGWIGFDPDGLLLVSVGENDFWRTARDPGSLYGKILRLDVLGVPDPGLPYAIPPENPFVGVGRGEVYVVGLRNPWRCEVDPVTGDLFIGDVGKRLAGELNHLPQGAAAGADLGWPDFEGFGCEPECGVVTEPVVALPEADGRGLTAGPVYRGSLLPELTGWALFSNQSNRHGEPGGRLLAYHSGSGGGLGEVRELTAAARRWLDHPLGQLHTPHTLAATVSFGRDAFGEVYLVSLTQGVFKLMPDPLPPDCDLDLVPDAMEILVGTHTGCPCPADLNGDGVVDLADYALFTAAFDAREVAADLDGDRLWTIYDHLAFLNAFALGCR